VAIDFHERLEISAADFTKLFFNDSAGVNESIELSSTNAKS